MKRIGITANPAIRELENILAPLVSLVKERGADVLVEETVAGLAGSSGMTLEDMAKTGMDVLITIGGDGTVLRALQHINVPILGVNMGRVGFLNEISPDCLEVAISRLIDGDYTVDVHERLCLLRNGKNLPPVLNEVVVHSSQALKIREFEVFLDGNLLDEFRSDGIIVATPTGSTGYAMSAGGPLLDLGLQGFLIMPLLPFRVAKRPNVVPMSSRIKIEVKGSRNCIVVLDGQIELEIEGGDTVELVRSEDPARFLRLDKNPYGTRRRTFEKLMSY